MNFDLPDGLSAYKRTPVFDELTTPAGLQRAHSTKIGVWGVIHILEGEMIYKTLNPQTERIASKETPPIVIKPQELHEVELIGPVLFYVEVHAQRQPSQ